MTLRHGVTHYHFRRASMADKSNDPVAMWQNMIGEMEKGFNALRRQGDGLAGILKSDEPGRQRRRGRAKAARRIDGEISHHHEPAEPGDDDRARRAAAVDRRPAERNQGEG